MVLSDRQLQAYVEEVSQSDFGWPFTHKAFWNSRLRTTGGRFFPKDGHLDFNPKFASHPDFRKIVRHELVHYHLYKQGRGFKHEDQDFKRLLAQVDGLRFAPRLEPPKVSLPKYIYTCSNCGAQYPRKRRMDTRRYVCSKCHGRLVLTHERKAAK
jgi:SprT-like protein